MSFLPASSLRASVGTATTPDHRLGAASRFSTSLPKTGLKLKYAISFALFCGFAAPAAACMDARNAAHFKSRERAALQTAVQAADCKLDANQADNWAQDATFQIGNLPAVKGRENIRKFLSGFFGQGMFVELAHRVETLREFRNSTVFRAVAIYALKDGRKVEIPYANWITYTREKGKLKFDTYRIFIDPSPLFEAAKQSK